MSIDGPILRKPDIFARVLFGATDSEEIGAALREAGQRDDIRAVFLDIDSPGGTVAGTPELAATVASSTSANRSMRFLRPDVFGGLLDRQPGTRHLCHAIRPGRIHRSGASRDRRHRRARCRGDQGGGVRGWQIQAMGAPGTPLTDDQRELINSNLRNRRGISYRRAGAGPCDPAEAMEGQTFSGRQAQRFNLAGMVSDRAEAMRRLRVYHAAVDTQSRAMNDSPEDSGRARTKVETLQRDYKAQADLLAEASTQS